MVERAGENPVRTTSTAKAAWDAAKSGAINSAKALLYLRPNSIMGHTLVDVGKAARYEIDKYGDIQYKQNVIPFAMKHLVGHTLLGLSVFVTQNPVLKAGKVIYDDMKNK